MSQWQTIHAHQFGNVYEWAGQLRTTGIAKDGAPFAAHGDVESFLHVQVPDVASLPWGGMDRDEFVGAAARSLAVLNAAHPFREGNGRSLRLLLDQPTEPSIWWIDDSRASRDSVE
ncbi:Fic family protein [Nocardia sp. alder85J]|nr:Fic family protein [Nocardia sp. alder85J]